MADIGFAPPYQILPPALPPTAKQEYPHAARHGSALSGIPDHMRFNTMQLSEALQAQVFQIAQQLRAEQITAECELIAKEDIHAVLCALELDFPEIPNYCSIQQNLLNNKLKSIRVTREKKEEADRLQLKLGGILSELRMKAKDMQQWQRAKLIYETVVGTVSYSQQQTPTSNSVFCLATGEGNLFGMAKAYQFLCNQLDVVCITKRAVLQGKYTQVFNCVLINDKWSNVDCGIAVQMRKDELTYAYFCYPDIYHVGYVVEGEKPPCLSFENSVYYINGGLVTSLNDIEAPSRVAANQLYQGKRFVDYLFLTSNPLDDFKSMCAPITWGVHRYIKDMRIDVLNQTMDLYTVVPVFRLRFTESQQRAAVYSKYLESIDNTVTSLIGKEISIALKMNRRDMLFVFDMRSDYETLKTQLCDSLATILGAVDAEEPIGSFNYAGDARAKVFKLCL